MGCSQDTDDEHKEVNGTLTVQEKREIQPVSFIQMAVTLPRQLWKTSRGHPKSHFLSTAGKKNTDTRLNRDKALMKNVRDTSVIFYMTVGVNAAGTANKSHQTLFCYKTAETQRRQSRQMTVTDAASSTCSNCRQNQGHFLVRLTFFAFSGSWEPRLRMPPNMTKYIAF